MAAKADRSRFTIEKLEVDHDCQAIGGNCMSGFTGKLALIAAFLAGFPLVCILSSRRMLRTRLTVHFALPVWSDLISQRHFTVRFIKCT